MAKPIPEETLNQNDPKFKVTTFQQMTAACTGSIVTSLIMTPLDVVKIRMQAQQKRLAAKKCFIYCNGLMDHVCPCLSGAEWYRRPSQFEGTLDAFMKITRAEGVVSLWSGLSPTLILAVPATVIYFTSYENLLTHFNGKYANPDTGKTPAWAPMVSGCMARLGSASLISPMELIRTKMQSKRLSYLEVHQALQSLLQYHGYRGLWKGLTPTLCRDVPFSGIYWCSYEYLKSKYQEPEISFWYSFMSGSISGVIASTVTTPFDVVKTHQQIEMAEEIFLEPPGTKGKSMFGILQNIYFKDGVRGLFTGLVPRVMKIAPACAIMISTFEYGKQLFVVHNMMEYKRQPKDL